MSPKEFKEIREKIGSQFFVADLLGVSQGQISIWEKGYRDIPESAEENIKKYKTTK